MARNKKCGIFSPSCICGRYPVPCKFKNLRGSTKVQDYLLIYAYFHLLSLDISKGTNNDNTRTN